jgi:hypothetical protein
MLALLICLNTARAEPFDRVVSVVGERVITQSEVELERAFAQWDSSPVPPLEQEPTDWLRRTEEMRLLVQLAGDVRVFQPDSVQVDARVKRFAEAFPSRSVFSDFLVRWDLDRQALYQRVYSQLVVEAYVERQIGLTLTQTGAARDAEYIDRYAAWMGPLLAQAGPIRVSP